MYVDLLVAKCPDALGEVQGDTVLSAIADAGAAREYVVHWVDHEGHRHLGAYEETLAGAIRLFNRRVQPNQRIYI